MAFKQTGKNLTYTYSCIVEFDSNIPLPNLQLTPRDMGIFLAYQNNKFSSYCITVRGAFIQRAVGNLNQVSYSNRKAPLAGVTAL